MRIAILSTPWPLFNRPSIQLGALKAFASREIPELRVDTHHLYLDIAGALGHDLYKEISEKTWLSECCYAALLYPGQREAASKLWERQSRGSPLCRKNPFLEICRTLETVSDIILEERDWASYRLLGFSVCFGQLTATLHFLHRIKRKHPGIKVVLGGSACSGAMGGSLLRAFPAIDFVISGEGELPFAHLVRGLTASDREETVEPVPGLLTRDTNFPGRAGSHGQVPRLDELPVPDYADYFDHLARLPAEKRFHPTIPMEMSRGCWWRGSTSGRGPGGCAFCNLNLQWDGYRTKSAERILRELEILTQRHGLLSVSFMDNLLPPADLKGLFEAMARIGKDLRLFAEIRATTRREELAAMGAAGVHEVQVGVEALSTNLLRRLNKGTTAIRNLEIMKHCEALGTPALKGNLILEFPGSDETDVEETLRNLEFALPFRPLNGVPFWLGRGSTVSDFPERFGIRRVFHHPFYARLFPPEALKRLELLIQAYQGGKGRQQTLWRPVGRAIDEWKAAYTRLREAGKSEPLLSYADGGEFLIIRQRRPSDMMSHRLRGTSREIYLFCDENRSLLEITARFPGFGEEKVLPFLRMMVDKRLMFNEGDRYLSLAVPVKGYGP
ncbi:MAG: RiPP maturation radical SAM C-methyltransferase [Deltaproteobacteria bacterium]|nr:RiPP maturation radical SAM C-methyltransferase [Deltaproteobacteria bacterium]